MDELDVVYTELLGARKATPQQCTDNHDWVSPLPDQQSTSTCTSATDLSTSMQSTFIKLQEQVGLHMHTNIAVVQECAYLR
jgi:hypothetical protein